ncbi:MAG: DUF3343 domain-containing protein [Firmicutes bacterium]|nr:DUF3343 domain-containing protein [Bacillota bacterium]
MKKETYGVITFKSTNHAIKGEKALKNINIKIKTIPTPREITSSCGLSIKFNLDDLLKVKEVIKENELAIKGIYKTIRNGFNKNTIEI